MGNIVKFKPNMDYYYMRGLAKYERDDFVGAICDFREAYSYTEPSQNELLALLEVEMASAYRNLGLASQAMLMYFKSISHSKNDSAFDSILGLIDMYGSRDNDEALKYYMDLAAKKGFSKELDFIEAATEFYTRREYKLEPTPDENMLELGKKLLEAGQYEFARQLLEVIDESSPVYGDTCSVLASLSNARGDYARALEYTDKAEDKYAVDTLVNRAVALYKLGRTEDYREIAEELAAIDTESEMLLGRIIRTAALLGEPELVIKFGARLAPLSPLRTPMLSYAVALCNTGKLRDARRVMVGLRALYPYDATVRVYSELIAARQTASDFPLTGELPAMSEEHILADLNSVLAESDGDKAWLRVRLRDENLRTGILMIFQAGSDNSKRIICDLVSDIPYYEQFIRDCLMDPSFPDSDKRIMLPIAVKKFAKRPIFLTCRDICRPLYGKPPAHIGVKWRDAYALAYGTLALFGCENYEKEFGAAFAELREVLSGEVRIDDLALAALIANRTGKVSALRDDECCIELFGADSENYKKYKDKLLKSKPDASPLRRTKNNNGKKADRKDV